jgi:hypothetical protein
VRDGDDRPPAAVVRAGGSRSAEPQ